MLPSSLRSTILKSRNYKYWVFGAISIGTFGSVMDYGSVEVALPTIAGRFETDLPTIQWVVLGFAMTIVALLLPMGRLADIVGSKKVYIWGSLVFVLGAGLAGSSSTLIMLILSRLLQGVGAAMTQGIGMAIVISVFPPSERGKAIGLIMTVVGAGFVVGPAIGGLLVDAFDWPYVFFINIPLGLLGIGAVMAVLEKVGSPQGPRDQQSKFDWLGAALSAGALVALLMAMTNGHRSGWASPPILAAAVSFVALLSTFIWWELRTANPMLDLRLFARRTFSLGVSAAFLIFLGIRSVVPDSLLCAGRSRVQPEDCGVDHHTRGLGHGADGTAERYPIRPLRIEVVHCRWVGQFCYRGVSSLQVDRELIPGDGRASDGLDQRRNGAILLAQQQLGV